MDLRPNIIGLIFGVLGSGVYLYGIAIGQDSKEVALALITAGAGIVNTGEDKSRSPDTPQSPPSPVNKNDARNNEQH